MEFSAKQIADLLEGEVHGSETAVVNTLAKIEEAEAKSLTFLANPKYTDYIYTTGATVVIVNKSFAPEKPLPANCTLIKVADAYQSFAKLLEFYNEVVHNREGISKQAFISDSASVHEKTYIAPGVVVDDASIVGEGTKIYGGSVIGRNVKIGKNCLLQPGVKILDNCIIGDNCTLHAGVVIGSDGFGFAPNSENQYKKVAQIGNVIIEDHVEIGANTAIDRATLGSTIIRKGVKLDNLIQVAHNVEIGENTVIAAQTGIAGSTKIGKNCMIGGQVGIVGHITIADEVKIAAQSGIQNSVEEKGKILQGSPAFAVGDYKRSYVMFRGLPKLNITVKQLQDQVNQILQKLG